MRKQDANEAWHSSIPPWTELGRMAQAGTISQVLSEGDLIPIRLTSGEKNVIHVTHDQRGNMFFVFEGCLEKKASMNPTASNRGGWAQSKMQELLRAAESHGKGPEYPHLGMPLLRRRARPRHQRSYQYQGRRASRGVAPPRYGRVGHTQTKRLGRLCKTSHGEGCGRRAKNPPALAVGSVK